MPTFRELLPDGSGKVPSVAPSYEPSSILEPLFQLLSSDGAIKNLTQLYSAVNFHFLVITRRLEILSELLKSDSWSSDAHLPTMEIFSEMQRTWRDMDQLVHDLRFIIDSIKTLHGDKMKKDNTVTDIAPSTAFFSTNGEFARTLSRSSSLSSWGSDCGDLDDDSDEDGGSEVKIKKLYYESKSIGGLLPP